MHATASVVDGVAYIAGCDEHFRGIRVSDGKPVLEVVSGAYTGASSAIANGRAFYGTFDNEVLAVELATKKIVWRYQHPERKFPFYASAAIAKDRVVVGGRDKLVHCLDATTGKALWTFATKARIDASPAIAGGRVYAGSGDGTLYVIDLADGRARVRSRRARPSRPRPRSRAVAL